MTSADVKAIVEGVVERLEELHPPRPQLLRINEVAEMLGLSERTVRTLVNDGKIASVLLGEGARRVELAVVERYIAARRSSTE